MVASPGGMEFRILGPIEARKDGLAVSPGGPKLRALLALLLVNANEFVSHAKLIDGLWGESPPESAAKALQVYVSQLRRELGRERIRTRPGGYELVVDPDALDLLRFERLVAEARVSEPAAASQKLGEALALWRGAALADVAEAAFAAARSGGWRSCGLPRQRSGSTRSSRSAATPSSSPSSSAGRTRTRCESGSGAS